MELRQTESRKEFRGVIAFTTLVAILVIFRKLFPERTVDSIGLIALLNAVFALAFLAYILLLADGIGAKVLIRLKIDSLSGLERHLFSLGIGLGILAYGVLALGLTTALTPLNVYLWLGLTTLFSWRELTAITFRIPGWVKEQVHGFSELEIPQKGIVVLGGAIFGLGTIQALAPPWGSDSLVYHLEGPRLFLEAGKILFLPEIFQANFPMTAEMLYTIGLVVESDVFAKLLHLSFAALLVLGSFSLGRYLMKSVGGWLAAGIMLGIPIFPIWGSIAYTDMAVAYYQFLAIFAFLIWRKSQHDNMLVLSGLVAGWALGSKYTAVGLSGLLIVWIFWICRRGGIKESLKTASLFGATAMLVGGPWYLKNWLLSGNPVFPFYFGDSFWGADRLGLVMSYLVDGFGIGRSLWDYLMLPFNLYFQHGRFGSSFTLIDIPSILFPIAIIYPLSRRDKNLDWIAGTTAALFILWALGTQQTRFLLPIYPLFSVIAAYVMLWLGSKIKKRSLRSIIGISLIGGLVASTLFYQIVQLQTVSPQLVVAGVESKQTFLTRNVSNYAALNYAEEHVDEGKNILMIWDGQGYYCKGRCIPDADQTRLMLLTQSDPGPKVLASDLVSEDVSHIMIDLEGLSSALFHDETGQQALAADYFFEQFVPICAENVFEDGPVMLFEIECID